MSLMEKLKGMLTSFGSNYYQKNFGIEPDEQVTKGWTGYYDPDVSNATQAGVGLLGMALGGEMRVGGVQVTLVETDKGRLVFGMANGRYSEPVSFGPSPKPKISVVGDGTAAFASDIIAGGKMMGPSGKLEDTKVLLFEVPGGESFRVILVESAVEPLLSWAAS